MEKLDLAWEAINALGGVPEQNNSYDQGFVDAVGKALEEIEKLGGMDPACRRPTQETNETGNAYVADNSQFGVGA